MVVSSFGSVRSADAAMTSVDPDTNAVMMSSTEASKLNDANCSTFTPGPAPSTGPMAAHRFTRLAWLTCTPFGTPVDPEV